MLPTGTRSSIESPVAPCFSAPRPGRATAAGLVAALHTKGGQIAQVWIRDENDVASRPAVPTVGAALRDVLFAAEV